MLYIVLLCTLCDNTYCTVMAVCYPNSYPELEVHQLIECTATIKTSKNICEQHSAVALSLL